MSEFRPVLTMEDLLTLDVAELAEGYRDGRANAPAPGNNRTRSYWHGWRNGRCDGGFVEPDEGQRALARAFHKAKDEANG